MASAPPARGWSGLRRRLGVLVFGLASWTLFFASSTFAQAASVPASLEAALLAKLEAYDRNFAARAGNLARTLVVMKGGSAKSELSANEMRSALARVDRIGGVAHEEHVTVYRDAAELAARCRTEHVAVVFIAAELDDAMESIRDALSGISVLSVGASPSDVTHGAVLGFELESGKPKIVVNLEQARRQHVDFSSDALRLMRVYR